MRLRHSSRSSVEQADGDTFATTPDNAHRIVRRDDRPDAIIDLKQEAPWTATNSDDRTFNAHENFSVPDVSDMSDATTSSLVIVSFATVNVYDNPTEPTRHATLTTRMWQTESWTQHPYLIEVAPLAVGGILLPLIMIYLIFKPSCRSIKENSDVSSHRTLVMIGDDPMDNEDDAFDSRMSISSNGVVEYSQWEVLNSPDQHENMSKRIPTAKGTAWLLTWLEGLTYLLVILTSVAYLLLLFNPIDMLRYRKLWSASFFGALLTSFLFSLIHLVAALSIRYRLHHPDRQRLSAGSSFHAPLEGDVPQPTLSASSQPRDEDAPVGVVMTRSPRSRGSSESSPRRMTTEPAPLSLNDNVSPQFEVASTCSVTLLWFVVAVVVCLLTAVLVMSIFFASAVFSDTSHPISNPPIAWLIPLGVTDAVGVQQTFHRLMYFLMVSVILQWLSWLIVQCLSIHITATQRQRSFKPVFALYHTAVCVSLCLYQRADLSADRLLLLTHLLKYAFYGIAPCVFLFWLLSLGCVRLQRCVNAFSPLEGEEEEVLEGSTLGKDSVVRQQGLVSLKALPEAVRDSIAVDLTHFEKVLGNGHPNVIMMKYGSDKERAHCFALPVDELILSKAMVLCCQHMSTLEKKRTALKKATLLLGYLKSLKKYFRYMRQDPWTLNDYTVDKVIDEAHKYSSFEKTTDKEVLSVVKRIVEGAKLAVKNNTAFWEHNFQGLPSYFAESCKDLLAKFSKCVNDNEWRTHDFFEGVLRSTGELAINLWLTQRALKSYFNYMQRTCNVYRDDIRASKLKIKREAVKWQVRVAQFIFEFADCADRGTVSGWRRSEDRSIDKIQLARGFVAQLKKFARIPVDGWGINEFEEDEHMLEITESAMGVIEKHLEFFLQQNNTIVLPENAEKDDS